MTGPFRHAIPLLLACTCLGAGSLRAQAQDEFLLKAALSYNFAKFATWPDMAADDTVEFCYMSPAYAGSFAPLIERTVQNRTVVLRRLDAALDLRGCDLLYLDRNEPTLIERVTAAAPAPGVLTVSDFEGFSEIGGMIEIQTIDNRLRFRVNLGVVQAAGISLSSQLLNLATEVVR